MNLNPYLLLIILALLIAKVYLIFWYAIDFDKLQTVSNNQKLRIEADSIKIRQLELSFELCREANKLRYCHE